MFRLGSIVILLIVGIIGTQPARAEPAGTGLEISAAGDLVGGFGGTADGTFLPREAEILLYAPIDHLFDGSLAMAAHDEKGEVVFELHELTLGSTRLIPRSRFRIGQYFLGIGRLNQFHRHDWPFTSAPKIFADLFGEEGISDSGIEYAVLMPVPFYLDLTIGVTNGWKFGHVHGRGTKPNVATHYARLATYRSLFGGGGLQAGLNYLGRTDSAGVKSSFWGLDLTAKWREAQNLKFLFQSEFWFRRSTPATGDAEDIFGFYVFPQMGLGQSLSLGMRLDGFTVLSRVDAENNRLGNYDFGIVPTITYKASEFSTIRLAYNATGHLEQGAESNAQRFIELQAVFILGSHPAHDF